MTQWTLISFRKKARKAKGKETTKARESPKVRALERANKMRKGRVLGKASPIKKSFKVYAETVARQDTNGLNVGAKGGGAAKQANSVGETENW